MGECEVNKFPILLRFQRNSLQRISAGAGSPSNAGKPFRSSFLSLYLLLNALLFLPLSPSFSLSLLAIPNVAYKVTMFILQASIFVWVLVFCSSLCLWYVSLHSGVTLFHSSTQGITSLRGVLTNLVFALKHPTSKEEVTREVAALYLKSYRLKSPSVF